MRLTSTELEEVSHLLAHYQSEGRFGDGDQARLRELLARERSTARTMDRDELVRFGRLVVGLWLVRRTARKMARGTSGLAEA